MVRIKSLGHFFLLMFSQETAESGSLHGLIVGELRQDHRI